jgi:Flp pilus assembly pilin Flp
MTALRRLAHDESGATIVEYALLLALVAVAAIAGLHRLELRLHTLFVKASRQIKKA